MSISVDDIGFQFALLASYILFTVLASAPIRCGVSIWRGGSLFPTKSINVEFCLSSFLRRCNHTFINTFCNFHTLKHVYRFLKRNRLAIKALNIRILGQAVKYTVWNNFSYFSNVNFIIPDHPWKGGQIIIQFNSARCISPHFKAEWFFHTAAYCTLFF